MNSNWIRDMVDFYGQDIFLAETSATCGGLGSLLEPTGPLRDAQQPAARTFGARRSYFVTNGTSTANKIVVQALVQPGDIVQVDRNCHQSHHYDDVRRHGDLPRGVHGAHLHLAELPDPGLARPPAGYRPSGIDQPLRSGLPNMIRAWNADEFVLESREAS